jgi:hypothetical protein
VGAPAGLLASVSQRADAAESCLGEGSFAVSREW